MRKNRVNKICETCGNEFEVIKAREKTAKFCCRKCVDKWNTGKPTWNSGKTYEECYDEETIKLIKSKQSHIGTDNGMYGKTHTSATKKIMSETHAGKTPWNKGKKTGNTQTTPRLAKDNAWVKSQMKKYDLTYDEYVAKQGEQMTYRRKVDVITNNQPLHTLENYDKRGLAGTVGAYHVDHIYPVSAGFKDGILPEIMGNIENLQMLPWEENIKKGGKID